MVAPKEWPTVAGDDRNQPVGGQKAPILIRTRSASDGSADAGFNPSTGGKSIGLRRPRAGAWGWDCLWTPPRSSSMMLSSRTRA